MSSWRGNASPEQPQFPAAAAAAPQCLGQALCKLSSEMQMQVTADKYRAAASEECPVALELCVCCALGAGFHVANANCALVCLILRRETWTGSPG